MNNELWDAHYELRKTVRSQAERIVRLEQIVLSIARGTESSIDDDTDDGAHTHWVYPLAETKVLLEEIKNGAAPFPDPSLDDHIQSLEDMEYDAEMALHDGQLCD